VSARDLVARSLRPDVRNPVLKLPGVARLVELPEPVREILVGLLMDIRKDAHENAQKCWKRHKAPMAFYWKVVAVYAGHLARAIRPRPVRLKPGLRPFQPRNKSPGGSQRRGGDASGFTTKDRRRRIRGTATGAHSETAS